jgi:tripartite-type tricarboxylate transporter receptor subunit TctC
MMTKLPRRQFLHLAAGAVALPLVSRIACAQAYPTRPVRIVVGFPAGSSADIVARLVGQWLSERLGQSFIVENKLGAASNLAAETVVRAPADGYTLLLITSVNSTNAGLYNNLAFNFVRDIAPVASTSNGALVLVVNPSIPAKTVPELIAYAKAHPGKINYASGGVGGGPHILSETFKLMAHLDLVHVPYRGDPQASTDLIGGQVQMMFATLIGAIEHIRAGRLRALAVTTATRAGALPDVPPMSDFLPGFEATGWQGIGAPKDTPSAAIELLNREINKGLADPTIKARLASLGSSPMPMSSSEFGTFIAQETNKWTDFIRAANIKPE